MEENSIYMAIVEQTARFIESAGIFAMVLGIILAAASYLRRHFGATHDSTYDYHTFRVNIGRSILLSLELLVGADLIDTVVMEPSMDNAIRLGIIVLIRTILSTALQIEINGYWPWEEAKYKQASKV